MNFPQTGEMHQRCAWTEFWTFWIRSPVASNSIRSEVLFPLAGSGLDFVFTEENITVCLHELYIPGLKQESDFLNLFGTGSGLDSDSQFAKQDWSQTQKNQSRNTSKHRRAGQQTALQNGPVVCILKRADWLHIKLGYRNGRARRLPFSAARRTVFLCSLLARPAVFCAASRKFTFSIWKHGPPDRRPSN